MRSMGWKFPESDPLLCFLCDARTSEAPRRIPGVLGYQTQKNHNQKYDPPWTIRYLHRPSVISLDVELEHIGLVPCGVGLTIEEAAGMAALGLCLSQRITVEALLFAAAGVEVLDDAA
jgi:hypothetical protein